MNCPFITLAYPVRNNVVWFSKSIDSFVTTTTNKEDIEVLLKIDSDEDYSPYIKILRESGFSHKILIYDRMSGFGDIQIFQSDLCKISVGDFIFICGDDLIMYTNDWISKLKLAYNLFDDRIMVCSFSKIKINKYGTKKYRLTNKVPVVSRKWFECCGYLSSARQTDKYLYQLGTRINRYLYVRGILIGFNSKKKHLDRHTNKEVDMEQWATSLNYHTKKLLSNIISQEVSFPEGICFA